MRAKFLSKFKLLAVTLLLLGMVVACTTENDDVEYVESVKDISGTWQVVQAFRNEQDITELMDFSEFRISFNEDNSYSFENYLPFLVKEQGTWALDDPQYPMFLNFQTGSSETALKTELNMPVKEGRRQLGLTFSPGCASNTYTYLFERVE